MENYEYVYKYDYSLAFTGWSLAFTGFVLIVARSRLLGETRVLKIYVVEKVKLSWCPEPDKTTRK